jgi:G8 domain
MVRSRPPLTSLLSLFVLTLVACTQGPPTVTPPAPGTPPPPAPPPINASGNGSSWSDPATWGGKLPDASSAVTIPAGKTVTLDSSVRVATLTVEGTLIAADRDLELTANWIMLHGQGKLSAGNELQPFTKRLEIQLSGTNPNEKVMGMGTKFLGTMGGTLELYGQPKRSWTRLNATAAKGATQLTLADPLEGWQVGDEIAIAPSDFDALEAEKRKITAINAQTVTLDRPLEFEHWGAAPQMYGSKTLDMRAEVGNLSRNIVVRSVDNQERTLPGFDPDSFDAQGRQNGDGKRLESGRFGGHMMFMPGSTVRLQHIEVTELGQQGMLGRYPIHWHLNQDASSGSFIKHSSIHDTFQRGLVIHQSNGVRAENNVIFNIPGHAVFLEDGVERNNVFTDNLVMRVTYVLRKHRLSLKDADDQALNRAERQSGFWITNPQNTVRGNVVAGVQNGWGFILADVRIDKIPVVEKTVAAFATNSYLLEFKDNVAHAINFTAAPVDGGASVFNLGYGPEEAGSCFRFDQRGMITAQSATVSGITAYKCRNAAFWSTNFKPVQNSVIADSRAAVINNQGEPDRTELVDSVVVARTANNPASRTNLDHGPFPGPALFEFLESGPVQFDNVLIAGSFVNNDNSTPAVNAPAPTGNTGYRLKLGAPVYLAANSSVALPITVDRTGGYNGAISLRLEIPKSPNLAADNPYYAVTSDPLTIPAGATTGVLTVRNGAHPKSGDNQVLLVAEGSATVANAVRLFTATAAVTYANAGNGNNVALLFADTASPRNPALSAMEFNRAGSFAVDGNMDSYAHASGTPLSWWQIDLERVYALREIRLRSSASAAFGDVWVLVSDFPVLTGQLTLTEALALPDTLVRRFEVNGSVGDPTTISLPAGSTGRFVRVWAKQAGDLKVPEVELISQ